MPDSTRYAYDAFPFLHQASAAVQADFAAEARLQRIRRGQFICMEGDACGELPLVLSGCARVYKAGETGRELTLYRIERGESCILTVSCIIGSRSFPAFAVAETDMETLLVPATTFRRWVLAHEAWGGYAFDLLARRLSEVMETVEEVAFRRLDARVAAFLLIHANPQPAAEAVVVTTHEAVAMELGSSREVVSRVLKELEREGLVTLARSVIHIVDAGRLRQKAKAGDARYGVLR
jgi:CRP/FNR family transcriptional regulator, anaerobic regulatory protein